MESYSDELKQKLFDLMLFYSGAEYVLAELRNNPSFNASRNGAFVRTNAPKVIDLIGEVLHQIGYEIRAFSRTSDGSTKLYINEPKDMGGILRDGAGSIAFIHSDENLSMAVGEQARFASDRFLPDSWDYLLEEIRTLCSDTEVNSLRKP
ncbi:hypothetical protein I5476_06290 [Citrobacter braakii]|uniref:hypothetical protein n=1 Tax=Citrobacter TaxID=544 RepID=UPI0019067A98|nr:MULTISPECIES: hypothetical protein [Citrobacter]MBJ9143663.1 hypothetical protein [Citrobacter braakii]MDM3352395.1 hypothetical protein [Citrobacter sp. Cb007]